MTACLGGGRGGGDVGVGQAVELVLAVDQHRGFVAGGQQFHPIIVGQLGDLPVERGELLLLFGGEFGTGMDEAAIGAGDQEFLVVIKAQGLAGVVDRLDALEQLGVQQDRILVGLQLGGLVLVDLVERIVGIGADQLLEQGIDAAQQRPAAIERDDGVVEGRLVLAVDDLRDIDIFLGDADVDGVLEVAVLDLVHRLGAIGQRRGAREGIAGGQGGLGFVGGIGAGAQQAAGHQQGQRENRQTTHGGFHEHLLEE